MKRLAVLHTVSMLAERFKTLLKERYPDLDAFHMVDESLLQDLMRHGESPSITRRIVTHATLARDAGAELIVFTCSSTSPAVDTARKVVDIPIIKIDDAMAEKAVSTGSRIGIVCTTISTKGPSTDLVHAHAAEQGREVHVTTELKSDAFDALVAGDRTRHDAIVSETALNLAKTNDVVILAQASLAHLQADLDAKAAVPVLASPPLCVESLAKWM